MNTVRTLDVIRTPESWVEGDAELQLSKVSAMPGMVRVVGMPDLHPGKGAPIGAVFFSQGRIYPHLVGNDIGCGMSLFATNLPPRRLKLDRFEKKLRSGILEGPWDGDAEAWLAAHGVAKRSCVCLEALGTIGSGNHFAEFLRVEDVKNEASLSGIGVPADKVMLLVHSGSRGLGEAILRRHVDGHGSKGLECGTDETKRYLEAHDGAVQWAIANRALIAHRMGEALGVSTLKVLDVVHNSVVPWKDGAIDGWLHRKGAAPANQGIVPVPGSRGARTYLVNPTGDGVRNLGSLAHGAGRKWKRSEVRHRLEERFRVKDLERTELGSRVICDDSRLIYEEAPEAYKSIENVVEAMVLSGIGEVVASLTPALTYKVSSVQGRSERSRSRSRGPKKP
ncbi:MAG: RNA ligase RtcB family protein [Deltaproteobacteria bacterium]|nr:RNA ligase RtcB family protein [Deltaproteobacteria bacterium]